MSVAWSRAGQIYIISFHPPTQLLRDGSFICGAPVSLLQSAGKNSAKARDGKNKRRKRREGRMKDGRKEERREGGGGAGGASRASPIRGVRARTL